MKLESDNISNLAKALVAAQKEMGNAVKDAKNPFFKSNYADLNAIREAVLPAFNKQGISVLQPTVFIDGKKFVQTKLIHESGEFTSGLTEILAVKETDAQAQGSGISYARRYGLQSIANVGCSDDDGEAAMGRKVEDKKPAPPNPLKSSGEIVGGSLSGAAKTEAPKPSGKRTFGQTQRGSEDL